MSFLAVICGLKSEAAALRAVAPAEKIRISVSGANAKRAEELAAQMCKDGARAIISVGVSGGLDPTLSSGALLIGEIVIADDGSVYASDRDLLAAITSAHSGEGRNPANASTMDPGFRRDERGGDVLSPEAFFKGAVFGADDIVETVEKKAGLFEKHGCLAVDMESHGAARAAARAGVPFIAIRAVADPADRTLPPAALHAVTPEGGTRILSVLLECAKAPGQFPALLQLGADSNKALKTLRRSLGPLFGRLFLAFDL